MLCFVCDNALVDTQRCEGEEGSGKQKEQVYFFFGDSRVDFNKKISCCVFVTPPQRAAAASGKGKKTEKAAAPKAAAAKPAAKDAKKK